MHSIQARVNSSPVVGRKAGPLEGNGGGLVRIYGGGGGGKRPFLHAHEIVGFFVFPQSDG